MEILGKKVTIQDTRNFMMVYVQLSIVLKKQMEQKRPDEKSTKRRKPSNKVVTRPIVAKSREFS